MRLFALERRAPSSQDLPEASVEFPSSEKPVFRISK